HDHFINHGPPQLYVRVVRHFFFFDALLAKHSLRRGRRGHVGVHGLLHMPDLPAEPAKEAFAGFVGWISHRYLLAIASSNAWCNRCSISSPSSIASNES